MADKKKTGDKNTMLWIAGTAAVTAGVYFVVQRYLKDRDELMEMRMMQKLQAAKSNTGSEAIGTGEDGD